MAEHALLETAYLALGTESALNIARQYRADVHRACLVRQDDASASLAMAKRYACRRIQFFRHVTKEQIGQAHEAGMLCNLFWSDDPQDAMRYVQNGIDVILTNCAHTMIADERRFAGRGVCGATLSAEHPEDGGKPAA